MKRLGLVLVAALCCARPAYAEVGGYQLFSERGNVATTPEGVLALSPIAEVVKERPGQYDTGQSIITRTVTQVESILRKEAGTDATNIQRKQLAARKYGDVQSIAYALLKRPMSISISIVDVIDRPEPTPPAPLFARADDIDRQRHEEAMKRFEQERKAWEVSKLLVVGRLNWTTQTVTTGEDRKAIAEVNRWAQGEIDRIQELTRKAPTSPLRTPSYSLDGHVYKLDVKGRQEARAAIEAKRKEKLASLKSTDEGEKPVHMVYVIGSDEKFAEWRRGQTRAVKGVVQKVGLFTYNTKMQQAAVKDAPKLGKLQRVDLLREENLDSAYCGMELVIWAVPDESSQPIADVPAGPAVKDGRKGLVMPVEKQEEEGEIAIALGMTLDEAIFLTAEASSNPRFRPIVMSESNAQAVYRFPLLYRGTTTDTNGEKSKYVSTVGYWMVTIRDGKVAEVQRFQRSDGGVGRSPVRRQ